MSDTKVNYEKLPWGECKPQPHYGVNVACRANTIVVTSSSGDLLFRAISDNSKTWIVGNSAASFSFDWLNLIKENVDAWIDSELEKLEEKERVEAAKVAHPVPPDGYRLCSKEEAKNTPSGLAFFWVDMDTGNGAYCTSAPRKFVRCTPEDAERLFTAGAYIEWYAASFFGSWVQKKDAGASATIRYRVDKYTIPEGFKLQPVMPTVRLPDGFGWGAIGSKIIAFEKDRLVMEVPSSKYHFDDFLRRQKLRQATLDAYDEIHDGDT